MVTDNGVRKFDQGSPHPLGKLLVGFQVSRSALTANQAWYQEHGAGVDTNGIAGRSFYTSLGHLNETWQVRGRLVTRTDQQFIKCAIRTDYLCPMSWVEYNGFCRAIPRWLLTPLV